MNESKVQSKSVAYARRVGMKAEKYTTESRRAAPDYIFFYKGMCFMIEFKATGKSATEAQLREHRIYMAKGIIVRVFDDPTHAILFIETMKQKIDEFMADEGWNQ